MPHDHPPTHLALSPYPQFPVLLGKRTMEYTRIEDDNLEPNANGFVPWRAVWAALQSGKLALAGQV